MRNVEAFVESMIKQWASRYALRARVHRVRLTLPVTAGQTSGEVPLDIPTKNPFLWCAFGWGSNRPLEGRYSAIRLQTEQVIFVQNPTLLGAFGGPNGEAGPMPWGPSRIVNTDRFLCTAFRVLTVDPAEAYPGNAIDSTIDLAFIGFDLIDPKQTPKEEWPFEQEG
ncbi:MAG: hypothetical protein PHW08_14145 [Kiritimatiellae bacterium]|nr:hypothetical protein [Kiritimatiellia bacterium]